MKKDWLFSGVLILSIPTLVACGEVCGDGLTGIAEQCDDTNTDDGDGCSSLCEFEPTKTDFRINELTLVDDVNIGRFNNSNLLIAQAIGNSDISKALTVLAKFSSTAEGATTIVFGPGELNADLTSFDFVTDLGADLTPIPATITGENIVFSAAQIILPIETTLGSGDFVALPVRNIEVNAIFEKNQKGEGGLFFDRLSDESTIDAQIRVGDLCAISIDLDPNDPNSPLVNLLDAFDDGVPANDSSIVPAAGEIPDDNNCQPCGGGGAGNDCVSPEVDNGGGIEDLYNISATFEAENEHPDDVNHKNESLIINAP